MANLTIPQAYQYAINAGFKGDSALTIVAIAMAETGGTLSTTVTNSTGNSHGVDRGILQINNYYHAEVSDAQAFNPQEAFIAAYRISRSGTYFGEWVTYTTTNASASYKKYLPDVQKAVGNATVLERPRPEQVKALFAWMAGILDPSKTYNPPNEMGVDIPVKCDTHVYTPYAGKIAGMQRWPDGKWGCVVSIHLNENVGSYKTPSFYFLHLDAINSQLTMGQEVKIGDFIGWSGGENSLAQVPSNNDAPYHSICGEQWSTGPHVEIGFNNPNGAAWAATGPNFDPREFLVDRYNALISGSFPVVNSKTPGTAGGVINTVAHAMPTLAGTTGNSMTFAEMCQRLDFAESFVVWNANSANPLDFIGHFTANLPSVAIRGLWLSIGLLLVIAGAFYILRKPALTSVPALQAGGVGAML